MQTQEENIIQRLIYSLYNITTEQWIELGKFLLPCIAIIISIKGYYLTKKNVKKQIRTVKLEEIMEILNYMKFNYAQINEVFKVLDNSREYGLSEVERFTAKKKFKKKLEELSQKLPYTELRNKLARFQVLTNTYLPSGKLKNDVYCIYDLCYKLVEETYGTNVSGSYTYYKDGYPKDIIFKTICENAEKGIIKDMELETEGADWNKLRKYRDTEFMKELKEYGDSLPKGKSMKIIDYVKPPKKTL